MAAVIHTKVVVFLLAITTGTLGKYLAIAISLTS